MRQVIERANGIPLFAVETIRMLIDDGRLVADGDRFRLEGEIDQLAVPESLRGLIGARIDGLTAADRALVQDAAVLGLSFTATALEALTGDSQVALEPRLRSLVRREILALEDDPRSPERGQYVFVQGLIREVAYETLSKKDRRARHLAAARYFETLDSEELAGVLATHYRDAYLATPTGPEADALAAQARIALRGAADRASRLGSHALALDYVEKALAVTPDPADQAVLHEAASTAAHSAALLPSAERHGRAALDWYRTQDDPIGVARAALCIVQPYFEEGKTAEASAVLEATLAETAAVADDPTVVALVAALARVQMQTGHPDAIQTVDRALVAAERLRATRIIVEGMITKGGIMDVLGRPIEGMTLVRGGIELAAQNGWIATELRGRANLANALFNDDPRRAFEVIVEARELARRLGSMHDFKWTTFLCYGSGITVGRWDWVLELTREIEEGDASSLDLESVHRTRGFVAAYRGQADLAASELKLSDQVAPEATRPEFLASRHSDAGEIAGLSGRLDEAHDEAMAGLRIAALAYVAVLGCRWAVWGRDLERARAAAELLDVEGVRGRFVDASRTAARAGLAALAGDRPSAVAGYRSAIATFRALETPVDLGIALMDFATLLGPDEAGTREAAKEARAIFDELGANALVDRLDSGLADWPEGSADRSAVDSPVGRGVEEPAPER